MSSSVTTKEDMHIPVQRLGRVLFWGILVILGCAGWRMTLPFDSACSESGEQNRSEPKQASSEGSGLFLSQMDFNEVPAVSKINSELAGSSTKHLHRSDLAPDMSGEKKNNLVIESPVYAPNDPVAWYKFDGNTDDSAGSAHGQLRGDPTFTQGVYDQAISFDGYRDSMLITAADNLFSKIRTGITITFWQYGKTSTHHRDTLCCSDYIVGLNHPVLAINIGCWKEPGEYNWNCGRLGSGGDRLTGRHRNDSEWSGRWNHWAFTKDSLAGKMQIFLNGELLDSRAETFLPISEINSFEIGSGWYGGYDGLIDDFRIYDYALSQVEIAYIATNDTGTFDKSSMAPADLQSDGKSSTITSMRQKFVLEHITAKKCVALLSKLGIDQVSPVPKANAVLIVASPELLRRAGLVLDIIDVKEEFVVENLGPFSSVRNLPSNTQIATALGDIRIGTFADPPEPGAQTRGIIDIHAEMILAIIPARYRLQLLDMLAQTATDTTFNRSSSTSKEQPYQTPNGTYFPVKQTPAANSNVKEATVATSLLAVEDGTARSSKSSTFILKPVKKTSGSLSSIDKSGGSVFANGEDILELDLPETMTLIQLLEFVGEYLDLDCVYDPDVVGKQTITLKLRGSLQGEMKVKDLYTLLETVLKFNGLAMTRRGDKLLTVVPVGEALDADPRLIMEQGEAVQAGDIVVTRMFKLRYVDAASVANLLENMKLGVAISSSEDDQILFVTCYAHRMNRIEQLIGMLDGPGKTRECRIRSLRYTSAPVLAEKLRTIAQELQGVPVTKASGVLKSPSQQVKGLGDSKAAISGYKVYIDTDERTNRVLMIGFEEQVSMLEELIDVLDVPKKDLRAPKTYDLRYITAQEALGKLQELEVMGTSTLSARSNPTSGKTYDGLVTGEPLVVVLEATNQLLVKATQDQHVLIDMYLAHIDVAREEPRILQIYEIQHVEAKEIKSKLDELDMTGIGPASFTGNNPGTKPSGAGTATPLTTGRGDAVEALMEKPHVIVNESTNSLLVTATTKQHIKVAEIIEYVDRKLPEEDIPYRIYPLENSSPAHVADLLEQIIQGTAQDKEGKIEETIKKQERITIVPDPNTFSLVVYASRKNQEWIANLIKGLDKRRPQVLIDVTLVEITRTDTFEYDLSLVASANKAVIGNIGIEPIHRISSSSRLEGSFNLLDQAGNPTGDTRVFYNDEKVQALLTAIRRKDYGRVLAKPKILVDDGQQGEISTTDETTYAKEAIQVPNQGPSITTRDFERVEATIQLLITPHISEGDLLRLDVQLSREDFGTRPTEGAPPDKATSQVKTTVFVPDNHTVILGGLVKLNQSKGGSKVPILGDIPLVGMLFRSVENSDLEKKLYVFLKANIVRPYDETGIVDLQEVSEEQRKVFEKSEAEFQQHQDIPGIKPEPMQPERVLVEP